MKKRRPSTWLALAATAALVAAAPVGAQDDPYMAENDSWIDLDGTVSQVFADGFTLDYGEGIVTVEMDDGDRDADGYKLMEGDKVSVTGRIDDNVFENTSIEASSVYVENLGTYFYASPMDEEDTIVTIASPVEVSQTTLQGVVTAVSDEEFVLNRGLTEVTISVENMPYDPLDDEGYQQLDVGDVVTVSGEIDDDFFGGREFEAEMITTLIG